MGVKGKEVQWKGLQSLKNNACYRNNTKAKIPLSNQQTLTMKNKNEKY
jgi:hypothetical protein